jgi:hypothetical protein
LLEAELEDHLRENVVKAIRRQIAEGPGNPSVLAELESALTLFVAFLDHKWRSSRGEDSRDCAPH